MIKKNLTTAVCLMLSAGLCLTSCSDDDDNNGEPDFDESVSLYASNNLNGNISVYDFEAGENVSSKSLVTTSTAADGIYFDDDTNSAFQASRSGNNLEGFADVDVLTNGSVLSVDFTGTSDMQNPREVAVNGNLFVVVDDVDVDGDVNTPDGQLYVYTFDGTSFTLRNVITTDFELWGITFKGNDLYAVVDETNELAVFTDFLSTSTDAALSATKTISVEGIIRTHGITYDSDSDTMIMTDIGEAGNAQDDGAFHIISGFTNKFNSVADGDMLAIAGNQVRVSGSSTLMGNPVDVAYDSENEIVFIAEAGNGNGRILGFSDFDFSTGGDVAPSFNTALASASAVHLDD